MSGGGKPIFDVPPDVDPLQGYSPDWRLKRSKGLVDPLGLDPLEQYTPDWRRLIAGSHLAPIPTAASDVTSVSRNQVSPAPDNRGAPSPPVLGNAPQLSPTEQAMEAQEQARAQKYKDVMSRIPAAGRVMLSAGREEASLANAVTQGLTGGRVGVTPGTLSEMQRLEQKGLISPGQGEPSELEQTAGGLVGTLPAFAAGEGLVEPLAEAAANPAAEAGMGAAGKAISRGIGGTAHAAAVMGTGSAIQAGADVGPNATPGQRLAAMPEAALAGAANPLVLAGGASGAVGALLERLGTKLASPEVQQAQPDLVEQARAVHSELRDLSLVKNRTNVQELRFRQLRTQAEDIDQRLPLPEMPPEHFQPSAETVAAAEARQPGKAFVGPTADDILARHKAAAGVTTPEAEPEPSTAVPNAVPPLSQSEVSPAEAGSKVSLNPKFKKLDDGGLELRYYQILDRIQEKSLEADKGIIPWVRRDAGWDSWTGTSTAMSGRTVTNEAGRALGRMKDDGRIAGELQQEMQARGISLDQVHDRYFGHLDELDQQRAAAERARGEQADLNLKALGAPETIQGDAHEAEGGDATFDPSQLGRATPRALGALAATGAGGVAGSLAGATPSDRRRNAVLGALSALGLYAGIGAAKDRVGAIGRLEDSGFYSRTERAINEAPFEKGTGAQWGAVLKQKGFREEVDRGMGKYLEANPTQVFSRQQVLDQLKLFPLDLKQDVRSTVASEQEQNQIQAQRARSHQASMDWHAATSAAGASQIAQANGIAYVLDLASHGDPVREVAIRSTLENAGVPVTPEVIEASRRAITERRRLGILEDQGGGVKPRYEDYTLRGPQNYREVIFSQGGPETYKAGHWPGVKNPIAHLRLTDREMGGVPATFIEEVQSDLHQKGRQQGYTDPERTAQAEQAFATADVKFKQAREDVVGKLTKHLRISDLHTEEIRNPPWSPGRPAQAPVAEISIGGVRIGEMTKWPTGARPEAAHLRDATRHWDPDYNRGWVFNGIDGSMMNASLRGVGENLTVAESAENAVSTLASFIAQNHYEPYILKLLARDAHPGDAGPWPEYGQTLREQAHGMDDLLRKLDQEKQRAAGERSMANLAPPKLAMSRTEDWAGLAVRRAIQDAVQDGRTRLGWTTGEQQVKRYNLSQYVDRLVYGPVELGSADNFLSAYNSRGDRIFHESVPEANLPEYIGGDLSDKLLKAPPEWISMEPEGDEPANEKLPTRRLEGPDLKMGGEGMKKFYDGMLPKVVQEQVRKLGGGKVEVRKANVAGTGTGDWAFPDEQTKYELTEARAGIAWERGPAYEALRAQAGTGAQFKRMSKLVAEWVDNAERGQPITAAFNKAAEGFEREDVDGVAKVFGAQPSGGEQSWYVDLPAAVAEQVRTKGLPLGGAHERVIRGLAGAGIGATAGAALAPKGKKTEAALAGGILGAGAAALPERGSAATAPEQGPPRAAQRAVQAGESPQLRMDVGGADQINPEDYIRLKKFPVELQPEVADAVRSAVARGDLPNPKTREPMEMRRQTSEAIIARDLATGHFKDANTIAKQLQDPTLSDADRAQLFREYTGHRDKGQALTTFFVKHGTETARELNARKLLAQASDDPFTWYAEAQRQLGPNVPLSDEIRAKIDGFMESKDLIGLHHFLSTMPKPGGALKAASDMVVAGLISGPSVFLKALGGGLTFQLLDNAASKVAAVGDAMASAVLSLDRSTVAWRTDLTHASVRGYVQGLKNAWDQVRGRAVRDPLLERLVAADPSSASRWAHYFESGERHYTNPLLEYGSAVLSRPATRAHGIYFNLLARGPLERSLFEQAHVMATNAKLKGLDYANRVAHLVEHPTDEMTLRALEQSQYASLRNRGLLAKIGAAVKNTAREESPAAGLAATAALPIVGVPANALARTLEYAGGGILSGSADLLRLASRALAEQTVGVAKGLESRELGNNELRARMLKRYARGGLGGGLIWAGYALARQGLMTGPMPDDPNERAAWVAAKRKPWSLKVGNKWVNVAAIIPVGPVMAMGAGLHYYLARQYGKSGDLITPAQRAAGIASMPVRLIAEQPFLTEPKSLVEAATQGGASASKVAANLGTAAIPYSGLLRQVARATDRIQRAPQGAGETIRSVLPGLSKTVPPAINIFGQQVTHPSGLSAFNPTSPTAESKDPVSQELVRLGYAPQAPKQFKGEPRAAYVARQTREGQLLYRLYSTVMGSEDYKDAQGYSYPVLRQLENDPNLTPEQRGAVHARMVGLLRSAEVMLRGTYTKALKQAATR